LIEAPQPIALEKLHSTATLEELQSIATLEELQRQFPTEFSCIPFLYQLKWPTGFVCPRCQHSHAYKIRTRRLPLFECRACRHQTSLIAGTVMEGSRTPLHKWLTALWLISRSDTGIHAVRLSLIIGVTYKTAWLILRKIRAALGRVDSTRPLTGKVNGMVAFYGHHATRQYNLRVYPLFAAASVSPTEEVGELKMKLWESVCTEHTGTYRPRKLPLHSDCEHFTKQHIDKTASDISIIHQKYRVRCNNPLYLAFKQAWSWMNDTFHGIGIKYLQTYLDEYCFRYNLSLHHTSPWEQLLQLCMAVVSPALNRSCTPSNDPVLPYAPTAA